MGFARQLHTIRVYGLRLETAFSSFNSLWLVISASWEKVVPLSMTFYLRMLLPSWARASH
jgi:hypothetical protein